MATLMKKSIKWSVVSYPSIVIDLSYSSTGNTKIVLNYSQRKITSHALFLDFTNWAYYRKEGGKYTPDDIDIDLCTHIVYGFAVLDKNTFQMIAHDSYVDEDKGMKDYFLFFEGYK